MDTPAFDTSPDAQFIQRSVDLARDNVESGGKPFACLLVRDGKAVIEATNQVAQTGDVTAHAEIQALRLAAEEGLNDLSDFDVYITAHPCPMCLGALYYAAPRSVVYAATREQEAEYYEDGNKYMELLSFYDEFSLNPSDRALPMRQGAHPDPASSFRKYQQRNG